MAQNKKHSKNHALNFMPDSYLERTSRPIYAIIFLLPFIIFYEIGTIFINTDILGQSQIRVIAFVWLREFLQYIGMTNKLAWIAPPLTVVVILFALQLTSKKKWNFYFRDLITMTIECVSLAIPLIVFAVLLNSINDPASDDMSRNQHFRSNTIITCSAVEAYDIETETEPAVNNSAESTILADIVTGIGAGIYEELIFRLILISIFMMIFHDLLRFGREHSIIFSVLLSAALFSLHHHIIFLNGSIGQTSPFNWMAFTFRTFAGIYFAVLFAVRGFGITAGTHAFYDIIAVFINAVLFDC